ncbi:cytoplasmic FMR1 interacting protein [Pycnococcus provasolii]
MICFRRSQKLGSGGLLYNAWRSVAGKPGATLDLFANHAILSCTPRPLIPIYSLRVHDNSVAALLYSLHRATGRAKWQGCYPPPTFLSLPKAVQLLQRHHDRLMQVATPLSTCLPRFRRYRNYHENNTTAPLAVSRDAGSAAAAEMRMLEADAAAIALQAMQAQNDAMHAFQDSTNSIEHAARARAPPHRVRAAAWRACRALDGIFAVDHAARKNAAFAADVREYQRICAALRCEPANPAANDACERVTTPWAGIHALAKTMSTQQLPSLLTMIGACACALEDDGEGDEAAGAVPFTTVHVCARAMCLLFVLAFREADNAAMYISAQADSLGGWAHIIHAIDTVYRAVGRTVPLVPRCPVALGDILQLSPFLRRILAVGSEQMPSFAPAREVEQLFSTALRRLTTGVFDESTDPENRETIKAEIDEVARAAQSSFDNFASQFASQGLRMKHMMKQRRVGVPYTTQDAAAMSELCLRGVRLLNGWRRKLAEHAAWRALADFTSNGVGTAIPAGMRLTEEERNAYLRLAGFIKDIGALMMSHAQRVVPTCIQRVEGMLRNFAYEAIPHCTKNLLTQHVQARPISSLLVKLRQTILQNQATSADVVSLSQAQLHAVRALFDELFHVVAILKTAQQGSTDPLASKHDAANRSRWYRGKHQSADPSLTEHAELNSGIETIRDDDQALQDARRIAAELEKNRIFEAFEDVVTVLSDLGDFGMRDEAAVSAVRDEPLQGELSTPWMLLDQVFGFHTSSTGLLERCSVPFQIYGDACQGAIHRMAHDATFIVTYQPSVHRCCVFDEVQAEADVAFDIFMSRFATGRFAHAKARSSFHVMDWRLKYSLSMPCATFRRYGEALGATLPHSVGATSRSVLVSPASLMAQRVQKRVRENADFAIERFEVAGLAFGLIEFAMHSRASARAYSLLASPFEADGLAASMDTLDAIRQEMGDATSLASISGRLAELLLAEVKSDLLPMHIFNKATGRFVRGTTGDAGVVVNFNSALPSAPLGQGFRFGAKRLNAGFMHTVASHRCFVGAPHARAMLNHVGTAECATVVAKLGEHVGSLCQSLLDGILADLMRCAPQRVTPPPLESGPDAVRSSYATQLNSVVSYEHLGELMSSLREIGNGVALLELMDVAYTEARAISGTPGRRRTLLGRFLRGVRNTVAGTTLRGPYALSFPPDPEAGHELHSLLGAVLYCFCADFYVEYSHAGAGGASGAMARAAYWEAYGDSVWLGAVLLLWCSGQSRRFFGGGNYLSRVVASEERERSSSSGTCARCLHLMRTEAGVYDKAVRS